jgi:hypothetical protein
MADAGIKIDQGRTPPLVWWCLFAGPFAWALDLALSYVLQQHSCSTGHVYVLHTISLVCFLIALSGIAAGLYAHERVPEDSAKDGRRPRDRAYFQVLFGIVFSSAFALAIIAEAVPRWLLSACD